MCSSDLTLDDGTTALAFVVDPGHPQYAGELSLARQAELIARAHGELGSNKAYLESTIEALVCHGVQDPYLDELCRLVEAHAGSQASNAEPG